MIVHVDASANEISSAICVVTSKKRILKLVEYENPDILEYKALLHALNTITQPAEIYSDCMELVQEINGYRKVKSNHLALRTLCRDLIISNNHKLFWISREKNLAGVYLEKRLRKIKADSNDVIRPIMKIKKVYGKEKIKFKKREY